MKKEIEIQLILKQRKIKVNKDWIAKHLEKIKKIISPPPEKIGIYLINNKKIKELNKKFLKKNQTTDVMAFRISKNYGEIFISVDEAFKNAPLYFHTLEEEILYLIIHGILHLKGFKDYTEKEKRKMFKKQDEIFKIIKNEEK